MSTTNEFRLASSVREEIEDFLYRENEMLDAWQLPQWYQLFDKEGAYHIVTPGMDNPDTASPEHELFLVSDDMERLWQRVDRLMKPATHVEFPHSRTSHMVSNVRIWRESDEEFGVRTRFLVHRTKFDKTVAFFGHQIYRLRRSADGLRIRDKRCVLDFDSLSDQGKLTIIL